MATPFLNPIPPVIWLLALPIAGIEIWISLGEAGLVAGGRGLRQEFLMRLVFFPDMLRQMVDQGHYPVESLARLFSYGLVHGNFTHALFAVVILLALGKYVGETFRWWAILAVTGTASVAGAFAATFAPVNLQALYGAYPPVYGLIGAFTFVLWQEARLTGKSKAMAFRLIGALLAFQLIFGLAFGSSGDWVADVAGFGAGFALSFAVNPMGWRRVVAALRGR